MTMTAGPREALQAMASDLRMQVARAMRIDQSRTRYFRTRGLGTSQRIRGIYQRRGHGYAAVLAVCRQLEQRAERWPPAEEASPLPEGRAVGREAVSESAHYAQGYRNGYEAALQGDVSPFCECGHYATHHRSTGCKWCDCTRMTYRTSPLRHDLPDPTKGQTMPEQTDVDLSDVHRVVDQLWSQYVRDRGALLQHRNYPTPRLDLASTQELLDELAARYIAQAAS